MKKRAVLADLGSSRRDVGRAPACALAVASLFSSAAARSAESPRVALEMDASCTHSATGDEEVVRKLLAIELGAALDAPSPTVTTAHVRCEESIARLSVDDPITRKSVGRSVDLSGYPESAKARALAIAAAELISASWAEASLNPSPQVPPVGPAPKPEARRAVAERVRSAPSLAPEPAPRTPAAPNAFLGAVVVRSLPATLAELGGALRFESDALALGSRADFALGVAVDVEELGGSADVSLGSVDSESFDVGASGYAVARASRALSFRGGAGVRVGHTKLTGNSSGTTASASGSISGTWTAPHLALAARFTHASLLVEATLEGGDILGGPSGRVISSSGTDRTTFRGGYLAPSLGAGLRF